MTIRTLLLFLAVVIFSSCALPSPEIKKSAALKFEEQIRLAAIYESKGELDLAFREYKKAADLNPLDARSYFGIGTIFLKRKYFFEAEENLKKAIDIDAYRGVYFNNLAWVYIETNRFVDAKSMVMRGLALDISRRYIYLDTLGVIEMKFFNYGEAERLFKEASQIIPFSDIEGQMHIYANMLELYTIVKNEGKIEEVKKKLEGLRKGIPAQP